jgi:mitochondrial fission protein ELM1
MMRHFSLIVASAETRFPPLSNVVPVSLPLMQVDASAVAAAAEVWRERFAGLPRPLVAMMVGGPTNPFVYNRTVARRLVAMAEDVVARGGTPYLTTSRRTPPSVVTALRAAVPPEARFFAWTPESQDNPYLGLLGLADGFIVTGDSISMMVEVARLRKPLAILPLPTGLLGGLDQMRRSWARQLFAPESGSFKDRLRGYLARMIYRSGVIRHTRDFRAFHQTLIDHGLAVWAGQGFPPPTGKVPDDLAVVVTRIRQLLEGAG